MTNRVHVKAELELFVDDASALRQSAFERMRSAWKGDDEFPYESADDVPIEQAVASALADALPIEFPGAKRSALSIEAEAQASGDDGDDDSVSESGDADDADDAEDAEEDEEDGDDKSEDADESDDAASR